MDKSWKTKQDEDYQHKNGHPGLTTQPAGLVISVDNPWLAASPDNIVEDPSEQPTAGLAEYKKPFSARDLTISEACDKFSSFCLIRSEEGDVVRYELKLIIIKSNVKCTAASVSGATSL